MTKEQICLQKHEADDGIVGLYDVAFQNSEEIARELKEEIKARKSELERLQKAHRIYAGFAKEGISTPLERAKAMMDVAIQYGDGHLLFEAAASGLPEARLAYAKALTQGLYDLPFDVTGGLSIYQDEADKGNPEACFAIVSFHREHPDLVDPGMAYTYCHKAAEMGYGPAIERLKEPFDESEQTQSLKKRFEAGEKGVAYLLHLRQDIPMKAREEYLMKALEEGDAQAEYDVGKGLLDAKEPKLAREYFEKSIAHGNGQACFGLAKVILHGLPHFYRSGGLPKKIRPEHYEELKLMQKAAEMDDIRGMCVMGRVYARGYLVPQDEEKAMALLEKAFNEGERFDAPRLIGEIYRNHKEARKAVEYYKIAAEHGNVSAMLGLMDIYESGLGDVPANPSKAAYYRFLARVDEY